MNQWPRVAGACSAVAVLTAALAGCSPPPPPVPPTVVNLTLVTTADANPTTDNHGAPLSLRVYQLAGAANFKAAEFFPLFNADAATLKSDLSHRDDFLLPPGQTKTVEIDPNDTVKAIAVFAAYRDFQHAMWRASADIPAHKTTNITVTAGHDGLTLKAETLPSPKPAS
jgi:type VI secretion system protein VasD